MKSVSIIIVTWESRDVLPGCLASIEKQDYGGDVETVVWDNNSNDGSVNVVTPAMRRVRLLPSPENVGFARGNNAAAREAGGRLLLFLNPDTVIPGRETLGRWVAAHEAEADIGISAPRLLNADGSIQSSVARFTSPVNTLVLGLGMHRLMRGRLRERWAPRDGSPSMPVDVDWVKGAAVMISAELFSAIGGWDESSFMYAEDQDLCWAVQRAGYRVFFDPDIEVMHLDDYAANKRWTDVERTTRVAHATAGMLERRYGRGTTALTLALLSLRHGLRSAYFQARGKNQAAATYLASTKVFARSIWKWQA